MRGITSALFALTIIVACGSPPVTAACIPGESNACVGPNACAGYQVCADDGTQFGNCICGAPIDASVGDVVPAVDSPNETAALDVTEASSSWSPSALGTALSVWLEADTGIVNSKTWQDQSGNGNDAIAYNQQSSWVFQVYSNEIHGHSAIYCPGNGTFFLINDSPSIHWGNQDWTLVFVGRITTGDSTLWQQDNQTSTGLYLSATGGNFDLRAGSYDVVISPQGVTKYHALIARGQQLVMTTDGYVATGPNASFDMSNAGSSISIGNTNQNTGPVAIAEIIAIKGTLAETDYTSLKGYLHDKYGL